MHAVVLQRVAGCVERCGPTSGRWNGLPTTEAHGTVHVTLSAVPVPDRAVGASDAIPMCLPRIQRRLVRQAGDRPQARWALWTSLKAPSPSLCLQARDGCHHAPGVLLLVSACTTTGLQHSPQPALLSAGPSRGRQKWSRARALEAKLRSSTYHPHDVGCELQRLAPRARGLALDSIARETGSSTLEVLASLRSP